MTVVHVNVTLGTFEAWSGFGSCVAGTADLVPPVVPLPNCHTGKVAETSPTKLADRDVGTVEVVPLCPLLVDSQKDVPALGESLLLFNLRGNSMLNSGIDLIACALAVMRAGRFVVQHRHQIVALGVVKSVEMCAVQCRQGSLLVHAKGGVEDVQ